MQVEVEATNNKQVVMLATWLEVRSVGAATGIAAGGRHAFLLGSLHASKQNQLTAVKGQCQQPATADLPLSPLRQTTPIRLSLDLTLMLCLLPPTSQSSQMSSQVQAAQLDSVDLPPPNNPIHTSVSH
jgi:hypothetical protein